MTPHGFGDLQQVEYRNRHIKLHIALFFRIDIYMSLFESVTTKSLLYGGTSLVSSTVKKDLPKHLEYGQCLRLLLDIGAQIENLKENRIGILYITKNDIEAINNGYKLYLTFTDFFISSNIPSFESSSTMIIS